MALKGLKVIEMAGLAPVPFAGMVLADFGATVTRVDKPGFSLDTMGRSKRSICISLKTPSGVEVVKNMCSQADVLIEPYRPGVMEKLGLGPDILMGLNPRLVYARLTGFGQTGSLAHRAGHDINYLAISGVLSLLGRSESNPHPPINLLADFAGGGMMCVVGILMALLQRTTSGKGQVVDVAMTEGVAYLSSFISLSRSIGIWNGTRGCSMLDGGAPFYETYKTSDGEYMSVGAIESQFYSQLLKGLNIDSSSIPHQMDSSRWPEIKKKFADVFATKTRQEWTAIFAELDACVEPVLSVDEASQHPHNTSRTVYERINGGSIVPNPAPKLSKSAGQIVSHKQPLVGEHSIEVLRELGYSQKQVDELLQNGTVQHAKSKL